MVIPQVPLQKKASGIMTDAGRFFLPCVDGQSSAGNPSG